jgi:outer membrane protein assembly factor BamB
LYAIDANTGALVWKYYANGISLEQSSPTVANGIVYIGGWYNLALNTKGSLYAIDAITGKLIWERLQNTGISSSPCVANGKLYITCDDLMIHALNATTGDSIWAKRILPNSASPAVANGIVYIGGGGSGYFYALDANTGAEKWKLGIPSALMTSNPLIVLGSGQPYYSGDSGLSN